MPKHSEMLSIRYITPNNRLSYEISNHHGKRCVHLLHDPPQYLDERALSQWMRETRDDDPNLYAELVHAYMLLKKPVSNRMDAPSAH